jgi:hypothetical protein
MNYGLEQRAAVGGDARFAFGCSVVVVVVAHSGLSYRRILAGNHPSGGIAPMPGRRLDAATGALHMHGHE